MSAPILPPNVSEYAVAMRAYHLAAAEWLGLDPEHVFKFKLHEADNPRALTTATWEAISKQEPRVGRALHGGRSDGETVICTGEVVLDYEDGMALNAAIGPEPPSPHADELRAMAKLFWRDDS